MTKARTCCQIRSNKVFSELTSTSHHRCALKTLTENLWFVKMMSPTCTQKSDLNKSHEIKNNC